MTITPSLVLVRPRTAPADDAELEVWGARRKRMLLERVLDREVEFTEPPRRPGRGARRPARDLRCCGVRGSGSDGLRRAGHGRAGVTAETR